MTKSTPSLRDVAQAAGVSLGTASRALNNKSNVLPATRSLVLKAAADLGYKLPIRMPMTIAAKINTVGVIVKRDPGTLPRLDPFYYAVLCGVEDECERLGLNLMYASLPVDEYSHAMTWAPLLENADVDGIIIVGVVFNDDRIARHIPRRVPVVVVDAYATGIECDTIITHNLRGAYNAVTHLIEHGHTRIGLIGSTAQAPEHPGIRERRLGYVRALSEHGITDEYIEDGQLQGESAYVATTRLLQRAPEVTGIFACNDDVAQSAMRAAIEMGRRIPEDISFVGFDDTPYALTTQPPLTTMRIDKELMGGLAVRQLYERAMNLDRPAMTTLIGTQLVVRDSVAKCATGQAQPVR